MKQTAFQTGDRVVLPPYGVGRIRGTCQRSVAGETHAYYQVEFPATTSLAYVPVAAPQTTGIRTALAAADMPVLLHALQTGQLNLPHQWSARHRYVSDLMSSGNAHDLAILIGELHARNQRRALPDLDRQAFRRSIRLLQQELEGLNGGEVTQVTDWLTAAAAEHAVS
ncbi:CarD family transcriptional regulator [Deinococcus gobiensis]|uniref:Transcriptional regulator, CarD family n=1 Tax=Deinococcus gobiensis (strain DSM 21396 / JCM 16679 / CGMCC 1.7299 / I-0) TaxID=745776 RepID=H8GWK7_DEIGI|nr:CarD family transcriptional regulator [Deinococcus gobiensis]AFD24477.1 Transcriptional regulator, CarD family [Deinococcus gobiensis I-0]